MDALLHFPQSTLVFVVVWQCAVFIVNLSGCLGVVGLVGSARHVNFQAFIRNTLLVRAVSLIGPA